MGTSGAVRSGITAETTTTVTKSNSAAEETLSTLASPTGLAAGDRLILRYGGHIDNSFGTVTYQFNFKLGSTTYGATTAISATTSVNPRRWFFEVVVALESVTLQRMSGITIVGPNNAASFAVSTTTGFGSLIGTAAEDLSSSKNAVLTCTMGTADANAAVSLKSASLEWAKKVA